MITVGVLGPLTVHRHAEPVPLAAPMLRRLLALLLCRDGRGVSNEELADAMWSGKPPATARKTLQVYVHRLRHALGDPDRVSYDGAGYRVVILREELDATRFADLVGHARAARRDARLDRADELFQQALDLWRGEPYADVSGMVSLVGEVTRLNEEKVQAREESLAVGLDLGRHGELVADLTSLARNHPYRETFRTYLMLALYRCGRRADALAVFRDTRAVMADELGVEPGAGLERLHESILRADRRLAEIAVADLALLTTSGRSTGSGREADTAASTVDGVPGLPTAPAQLPADIAAFTGRLDALRELDKGASTEEDAAAASVAVTAITGMAGVGKTALAVHWAHRATHHFPDGQLYVDLRGFDPTERPTDPADVLRDFLEALAVPSASVPTTVDARASLYRTVLAGKRVLVLLDNARDTEQVRPLLPGTSGCLVLVTSRNQLAALVATHGVRLLALDELTAVESRRLIAKRVGPDRVLAEPEAVEEIIKRCGRLPLALAIVSARAAARPGFPLRVLAAELRDARGHLNPFVTEAPTADVRAIFSWSYRRLSDGAATLFRLLGLHPGPDVATPAVASLAGRPVGDIQRPLAELTRACLIVEHAPGRFTLHDLLRAYAAELVHTGDSKEDRHAATGRMLDHYLHTAHAGSLKLYPHRHGVTLHPAGPDVTFVHLADHAQAMAWFTAEHSVLKAVLYQAAEVGCDVHAWQLAWSLHTYFDRRGHWEEYMALENLGLEAARRLPDRHAEALSYHCLASAQTWAGHHDEAHVNYEHAIALFEETGDDIGRAHSHLNRALLFEREGRQSDALDHAQRSLDLFRASGHRSGEAKALNAVGWYEGVLGRPRQALTSCRQAIDILRELGDRYGEALTWDSIGYAHHVLGDHREATVAYQRSIELWRTLGDRHSEAAVLQRLGDDHHAADDRTRAESAWRHAMAILDELGDSEADHIRARLTGREGEQRHATGD